MSIVFRLVVIIITFYFSPKAWSQKNSVRQDSSLYYKFHLWDIESYPKSLIESNKSEVAFCKISFTKNRQIDTIIIFNTNNDEVIDLIRRGMRTINFKRYSVQKATMLIPFVFKNFDNISNNTLQTNLSDRTLSEIFNMHKRAKRNFSMKIFPPVYIRYSDEPRKK